MPVVTVSGCASHYTLDDFTDPWGPEPDVILIQHGTVRNGRFWRPWVPRLSRVARVVRRDLIGHGESEDPGPDYRWSVDALADDLAAFLDAIEVAAVHYVGDSFGGVLGACFGSRHPNRVKSLTLCSTPPHSPVGPVVKGDSERVVTAMGELGAAGWAQMLLDNGVLNANSPEQEEWVVREAGRTPLHVIQGIGEMLTPSDGSAPVDVMPLLPTLEMPVLFVAPPASPMLTLADQVAMRDATPGAEIAVIPVPGHEIYVTGTDRCIDAMLEFIRRRCPGALGNCQISTTEA